MYSLMACDYGKEAGSESGGRLEAEINLSIPALSIRPQNSTVAWRVRMASF